MRRSRLHSSTSLASRSGSKSPLRGARPRSRARGVASSWALILSAVALVAVLAGALTWFLRANRGRAMAYDALGRRVEADKQIEFAAKQGLGWEYQAAQIYANPHDRDRAFEWLERARESHDPGLITYFKCDPMLAELRADPRYHVLLTRLNLPQ